MAAMLSVAKSRSDSFHDSRRQAVAGLRGDGHLRADSRSSTRSMPERARSSAIMTGRILVSAFLLLSCDGRRPAQVVVDQRSSPIVGGTSDDSHPDVVALIRGGGRPGCTGTLISTNVVVTAAHCVEASSTTPEVFFGSDVTLPGQARAVSCVRRHPTFDRSTLANDLAIVVLDEPATIAPATLGTSALDSTFTGTSLRIVGFGRGQGSGAIAGSKMQGTTLVTAVFPSSFTARPGPAQACEGDSGGPAFLLVDGQERLVGVTSAGDAACEVSASYTRIDPYVPFIQRYVEAAARTEEVGSRCYHATNCVSGARCAAATDDARISYCTKECAVSGECPPGMQCEGPATAATCRFPTPTPGALGSPCTSTDDCESSLCSQTREDHASFCTLRCFRDNQPPCASGFSCEPSADQPDQFVCARVRPASDDAQCSSTPASQSGPSLAYLIVPGLALTRYGARRRERRKRHRASV